MFCEQCEYTTHMGCLDPPLDTIPEDDWYCPDCKNDASEIVQVRGVYNAYAKVVQQDQNVKRLRIIDLY